MLRIVSEPVKSKRFIKMSEMKPCQAGRIVAGDYKGEIVMRTASTSHFEVMNISVPGAGKCWTGKPSIEVELLDTPVTIEIDGK